MTSPSRRVALVTCAAFPDLEDSERLVIAPLADRGVTAVPVVWDDPSVDWDAFDLVVIRGTWDYVKGRHAEFLAWAESVPRLANAADIIAWNTDKTYLDDLIAAGVPVVPTEFYAPGERPSFADAGLWVVKPTVSAGSLDTERYDFDRPQARANAGVHVARLHAEGRTAMVQPYLSNVDTEGETALLFFAGRYSHAIRKGPLLSGERKEVFGLYVTEDISPRTATPQQLEVAAKVLAAVPGGPERLLYARVDLIAAADGSPTLLELELAEPSLFLDQDAGAAESFAAAIAGWPVRLGPVPGPGARP